MRKSSANLSVIARRATANGLTGRNRLPGQPGSVGALVPVPDAHNNGRIRAVGYLGRNRTSVHYSGSGDKGYGSAWSGSVDFHTDARWSQTVSNQNSDADVPTTQQVMHPTQHRGPAHKAGKGKR